MATYTPGVWANGERVKPTPAQMQNLEAGVVGGNAAATAGTAGQVKKAALVAPATVAADGTSAGTQLNALIVSLRTAGIIT
ncbi:head fiber protein [Subtercola sp. RTI3]|uniref:head fiber protein n=1 Tax=Subtercola sp. RTI3 TaxID=3048639 RepID=UPI002B23461D|nr:head fiber protein [Subtercola sp. RTI3]MEA9983653.1 head fiber protein [Subtercola sp. RTI3]